MSRTQSARLRVSLMCSVVVGLVCALALSSTVAAKPAKSAAGPLVVFLLPENVTARWEGQDKPLFIAALKKLVPGARVQVQNALNDPAKQQAQAESALVKGAKVIVIAAVDQKAAAVIVNNAAKQKVPVPIVAYDRLIRNAPLAAYVSFDSTAVGFAEASWIAQHTKKGARIVIINGSPTDDNAHLVNTGIHQVMDPLFKSGDKVLVSEAWVPGWDPSKAQAQMEQILTKAGNKVDGVVSANDGMAGGIIAALQAQGLAGKVPVSGQDASVEGLQRVVLGTQGVSVFKDFRLQAPAAAQVAAALLGGKTVPNLFNSLTFNGQVWTASVMLRVVGVDKSSVGSLVENGWITKTQLCKGIPAGTGPC